MAPTDLTSTECSQPGPNPIRGSSVRASGPDDFDGRCDSGLGGQRRRIQKPRVIGRLQRRRGARAVATVALDQIRQDLGFGHRFALGGQFQPAPVRPGRTMSTIIEVAARNQLLKLQGHHSARAFQKQLNQAIAEARPNSFDIDIIE